MTFQHGCPHHCIPPGRMYFLNISIKLTNQYRYVSQLPYHLAKSHILKSSPKLITYIIDTISDVSRISLIFTKFSQFPRDVSETHTSFHPIELQFILHYASTLHGGLSHNIQHISLYYCCLCLFYV